MAGARNAVYKSIFGAMLLTLILLTGCGASGEVKLDAGDDGSQVELKAGQVLVVALDSNPTTGYRWERVPSEDGVLEQDGDAEFIESSGAGGMVGAGGQEILRFNAAKPGTTSLELVYHRPWEADAEPEGTFTVGVVVR